MIPQSLTTLLAFIVAIGLLVVIHEFGHYWVARQCGIKVLRFAVGFGPTLWSRRYGPDETEWALCAIPLGGYVKMLDEREGVVPPSELPRAFNRQTLGKRSLVVAAGPAANLLLAVLLYWALFMYGNQEMRPVLAAPPADTIAALAGIESGDQVISFDGHPIEGWDGFRWRVLGAVVDGGRYPLEVQADDGSVAQLTVDLSNVNLDAMEGDPMRFLGLSVKPPKLSPVIGQVIPDRPADRAGIRVGDRVVSINGQAVSEWREVATRIAASANQTIVLEVERGSAIERILLTAEAREVNGKQIGQVGIAVKDDPALRAGLFVTIAYPAHEAFFRALMQVWETSVFTLRMMGRMVVGELSLKNISGPVTIAEYAGQSARLGLDYYLKFLALISISIGVLNLLPVPVLDGGHLMYYFAEFLYRKPLPEQVFETGQRIGLAILVLMMGIALFNDLNRQFFG